MDVPAAVAPTLPAAVRFAFIINGLIAAIGARCVDRENWSANMILYLWDRVTRINLKFQKLTALIQAGKLPPERAYKPRPPKDPPNDPPKDPLFTPPHPDAAANPVTHEKPLEPNPGDRARPSMSREFPQEKFGWLSGLMPSNRFYPGVDVAALELRVLIEDPEMRALLAATPRMRKLLRPLFWMLGLPTALLGEFPPRRRSRSRSYRKRRWRPAGPTKREIMAVINDRPGPIHGRGGPPFMPGESPRGGFPSRTVRAWGGKPPDFSKPG